jgi:hypothetical protein
VVLDQISLEWLRSINGNRRLSDFGWNPCTHDMYTWSGVKEASKYFDNAWKAVWFPFAISRFCSKTWRNFELTYITVQWQLHPKFAK